MILSGSVQQNCIRLRLLRARTHRANFAGFFAELASSEILQRVEVYRTSAGSHAQPAADADVRFGYSNGIGSPHCGDRSATQTLRPSNCVRTCSKARLSLSLPYTSVSTRNARSVSSAIGATSRSPSYPANLNAAATALRWPMLNMLARLSGAGASSGIRH